MSQIIIDSATDALARFRKDELQAQRIIDDAMKSNKLSLINAAPGIGKSVLISEITKEVVRKNDDMLVVILVPTHDKLNEFEKPIRKIKTANPAILGPRPYQLCGEDRDAQWKQFEEHSMSMLAKNKICANCEHAEVCTWKDQLTKKWLLGRNIVLAVQAYVVMIPAFLANISKCTGKSKMLVLIDEADFSKTRCRKIISTNDVLQLKEVAQELCDEHPGMRKVINLADALISGHSRMIKKTLKCVSISQNNMFRIQQRGFEKFSKNFRFIGYDIQAMKYSSPDTWEFVNGHPYSAKPWAP